VLKQKKSHHEPKIQTSRAKTRLEAGPPQGFSPSKEITSFAAITCQQSIITASYQSKVVQHTNRPPYRHRLPTARRGRAQHQSTQPNANATKPAETYIQWHHRAACTRATAPTSSCCSRCFSCALCADERLRSPSRRTRRSCCSRSRARGATRQCSRDGRTPHPRARHAPGHSLGATRPGALLE